MQLEIKWTTTYDRITDVITRLPFNIDGNWWKSGDISFSRAFDKDKRCNMLLASKYIFAQRTDYINDAMQQNPHTSHHFPSLSLHNIHFDICTAS